MKFSIWSAQELVRLLAILVLVLVAFLVLRGAHTALGLPDAKELIALTTDFLNEHGYLVVFIASLLEGLLLLGWYLPGSVVMVLAVIASKDGPLHTPVVVIIIILGFTLTSLFNYALGKYGWYRLFLLFGLGPALERMRLRTKDKGLRLIWSTYFHPNVGTLTATSCGILRLPFAKFATWSAAATALWNTLWGVVVYFIGDFAINFLKMWVLLVLLLLWVLGSFIFKRSRKAMEGHSNASC